MYVINARNAHQALYHGLDLLKKVGQRRESRNGPVVMSPMPVTTYYSHPCERVVFWPGRDANPFLHLYEALWILAGRSDVAGLARYAKNMLNYSDDGRTFWAAYGARMHDQLGVVVNRLRKDPDDRRCVVQIWDKDLDLGGSKKDHPCNVMLTFQRGADGALNLVMFNRSNDIIWGCYGANVVQFSTLLECMALQIGCAVGTYHQVSVNWHMYEANSLVLDSYTRDPYASGITYYVQMTAHGVSQIPNILNDADTGFLRPRTKLGDPWTDLVWDVLRAHEAWRIHEGSARYETPLAILHGHGAEDWAVAAREWIQRRYTKWLAKA